MAKADTYTMCIQIRIEKRGNGKSSACASEFIFVSVCALAAVKLPNFIIAFV